MKKIILSIFFYVVLISCSSSADEDNYSTISINPPKWIQGTWLFEGEGIGNSSLKFTKNDLIILNAPIGFSNSQAYYSIRDGVQIQIDNEKEVNVISQSSDDTFILEISYSDGSTDFYSYVKITKNRIKRTELDGYFYIKQ